MVSDSSAPERCWMCGSAGPVLLFHYDAPPEIETRFDFSSVSEYRRDIWRCRVCGHCENRHGMDMGKFYEGRYVDATYGADGLLPTYRWIMDLPPERSDNHHRVRRVVEYMRGWFAVTGAARREAPTALDVGSGLCVFGAKLKDEGWLCTALDPDPRAVEHARAHAGVEAVCADFMTAKGLGRFDLVTLNKVIEHVSDPVAMLRQCHRYVRPQGVVYVELPDAEEAGRDGPEREEFGLEHYHVFSMASMCLLCARAGFVVRLAERVREPSTKYTLRVFLTSGTGGGRADEARGSQAVPQRP